MRYISIFSGIEAASVAWEPLGWEPVAFAEIEKFPSAVLAERFPDVPNLGDVTQIEWGKVIEEHGAVDVLVGGSPCQSFSIAGNRDGLDGASGLMWEYVRAVQEIRPRWLVWENVPGALSSGPGKGKGKQAGEDFGCLLRSLDELGYGLCWRILDAQFFGVAQRRRRVFLVGCLGAVPPVEVLFERDGLRWDYNPSREEREILARAARIDAAQDSGGGVSGFKWNQGADAGNIGYEEEQSPTVIADWHNPAVVMPFDSTQITHPVNASKPDFGDPCHALAKGQHAPSVVIKADDGSLTPWDNQHYRINDPSGVSPTILCQEDMGAQPPNVIAPAYSMKTDHMGQNGKLHSEEVTPTLDIASATPVVFQQNQREEVRLCGGDGSVAGTILESPGMKNTNYVMCMADTQSNTAIDDEMSGTLNARMFKDPPLVGYAKEGE